MNNIKKIYKLNLKNRAISVYYYLNDRKNSSNVCWPSIATIAKDLSLSKSTVRRAIKDLLSANLIKTSNRYRDNGGCSSLLYEVL